MNTREFLETIITGEKGYFILAFLSPSGSVWNEEYYQYPEQLDEIVQSAEVHAQSFNVYFSSYLFSAKGHTKDFVVPSRTIQADLDEADIHNLVIEPTVLVESSPGRHQGYWILEEKNDVDTHEILSRKLTYAIAKADHSGWPLGRLLRLPGTVNHKYLDGPKVVKIVKTSTTKHFTEEIELLPDQPQSSAELDNAWIDGEHKDLTETPHEILDKLKEHIPAKILTQYDRRAQDRSAALWALMQALFRAGLDRDQVYWICQASENNKFADLRYHSERELAKDVLRAEQVTRSRIENPREQIMQARTLKGLPILRKEYIKDTVLRILLEEGEFVHTVEDELFYIKKDIGRPIAVEKHSPYLDMLMDLQFGLNSTEIEHSFTIAGIISHTLSRPAKTRMGVLSVYNQLSETIFLHTGRKDVKKITAESVETVVDGAYDLIFPWESTVTPFNPSYEKDYTENWYQYMYGVSLNTIIDLDPKQALAILRVWTIFLILRSAAISRPILAAFGQPGGGKSTLFRKIYILLYGEHHLINTVTTPENFDTGSAHDPFYTVDNVDTWERWLPDRLAAAASNSDITKRKLYSNNEVTVVKRQAMVGINAHDPKFGREDVVDRMLLFNFERISDEPGVRIPETDMVREILDHRNGLWQGIINDVQLVLQTPKPPVHESPPFRVEDFARFGNWIATALGMSDDFKEGIRRMSVQQRMFSVQEEQMLVSAMYSFIRKMEREGKIGRYLNAGTLWSELEVASQNPQTFIRQYHNAVALGKKLWVLQTPLKEIFKINWKVDTRTGARLWDFQMKEEMND